MRAGATIDLALDQLQLGDLAVRLTIRPGFGQGGPDSSAIGADPLPERGEQIGAGVDHSRRQRMGMPDPEHPMEPVHHVARGHQRDRIRLGKVIPFRHEA